MGMLRVTIKEGMLTRETHKMLIYVIGYIAWRYRIAPSGADLEGAIYENIERKIYRDVKRLLRRKEDRFLEVSYEE